MSATTEANPLSREERATMKAIVDRMHEQYKSELMPGEKDGFLASVLHGDGLNALISYRYHDDSTRSDTAAALGATPDDVTTEVAIYYLEHMVKAARALGLEQKLQELFDRHKDDAFRPVEYD